MTASPRRDPLLDTLFATIQLVDLSRSLGDHMALIDAIETGNGSVAAEKMISHIRDGKELQMTGTGK